MDSTSALAASLEALHPRPLTVAEFAAISRRLWTEAALRRIDGIDEPRSAQAATRLVPGGAYDFLSE